MKNLKDLYKEHEQLITDNLPNIKHVDLWSEQVSFLMDEHPFKAPAIFLSYRTLRADDNGKHSQVLKLGVDVYYYYETFADTRRPKKGSPSKKQDKALAFLDELTCIHQVFHGKSGTFFNEMRRVGFAPIETGTANLLYVQKFECTVVDDSAVVALENTNVENVSVIREKVVSVPVETPYHTIETQ